MLTYGFFHSVNNDRTYNCDDFNNFFEGLIPKDGIFENVGGGFSVNGVSGAPVLLLTVAPGKAMINSHWVKNDGAETLELEPAHNVYSRYDAVVLQWSATDRDVKILCMTGTPSTSPTKYTPKRFDTGTYEIVLAYVHVKPNITKINEANIEDCRYDTELCGVITGLIDQVDTSTLYRQYAAKFEQLVQDINDWKTAKEAEYSSWFATLTGELNVNTSLARYKHNYITASEEGTQNINVPAELNYVDGDILDVFVNGVLALKDVDYTVMTNEVENVPMVFFHAVIKPNNIIAFHNTKCVIGGI